MYQNIKKKHNVNPGEEFVVAYKEAQHVQAKTVLVDRNVQVTLKRAWNSLSLFEKIQIGFYFLKEMSTNIDLEDVEKLKSSSLLIEAVEEFSAQFPNLARTLVDERDQYLAAAIRSLPGKIRKEKKKLEK
jgi:pheromone shutdown protein TraB